MYPLRTFLTCLVLLFLTPRANGLIIEGRLDHSITGNVSLSRCINYIAGQYELVATAIPNEKNEFSFNFPTVGIERFKITVDDLSISFYASNNDRYILKGSTAALELIAASNTTEGILRNIDAEIIDWKRLWIDSTKAFHNRNPAATVLSSLERIKQSCTISSVAQEKENEFDYLFADHLMHYVVHSYVRENPAGARQILDSIAIEFLELRPVAMNNPFYVRFLQPYIQIRLNSIKFQRFDRSERNPLERLGIEASHFRNDGVSDLIYIAGVDMVYKMKWFGPGATKDEFNEQVKSCVPEIRIAGFHGLLKSVIAVNNKWGTGDLFPSLELVNEKLEHISIHSINSPFTLIDFWATWCSPCIKGMQKFPGYLQRYKNKLAIVSISADKDLGTMKHFLEKNNYSGKWTALFNGEQGKYFDRLRIDSYPTYILLDREKKIVATPASGELEMTLERILDK